MKQSHTPSTPPPKTALITGAAQRLGRAMALALAAQGWDIVVHYRSSATQAQETAAEIRALGRQCHLIQADLSEPQAAPALFARALEHSPSIDLLINNASLFEYDSADKFDAELLQAHLGPNLVAPLQLTQCFAQQDDFSAAVRHGVVIHFLDQKLWHLNPDFFSYTLCKAALQAAVGMHAQALAPRIRVMGIAPGLTLPSHLQSPQDFERTHQLSPLGQGSTPKDITDTVLYIANTSSLTGSTILVDAGQHLMGLERDFSLL